jgi:deoxycytidine triphosphate deaminase
LLSDEIKFYVEKCKLIDPFDEESLKPAAYELRVGYEYAMDGKIKKLSDATGENFVEIPPFQVVVIKTMERVNLPRFMIARWNIRVRKAYDGLLWVGGPQVDPGYVGYLSCPIYNLSDKAVKLELGDNIAVIDFVKTTPFSLFPELASKERCKSRPLPRHYQGACTAVQRCQPAHASDRLCRARHAVA